MKDSHIFYIKRLLFMLVCFLLIIYIFSFLSLNFRNDEGFTMALIHHSFLNLIRIDSYDVHPPLYYIILKFFINITTFWTKSIFVKIIFARIFSFISFILSFLFLTKIFNIQYNKIDKKYLFIVLLLFPSVLFFATQIRMYSFGAFLLILGIYFSQRFLKHYYLRYVITFFLCMLLASFVHYYYALFAGLLILILSINYLMKKKYKRTVTFLMLDIVLCICYLPWILYTFNNVVGFERVPNFSLKKILTQVGKIILIPTGILSSSLNGVGLTYKIILIAIIYIVLIYGTYIIITKFNYKFKKLFYINLLLALILIITGVISDLFGYEFSVSFLFPSLLIIWFMIITALIKYNKVYISLSLIIVFLTTIGLSIGCNVINYNVSLNQIDKYESYQKKYKYVYISPYNNIPNSKKMTMQLLRTHKPFIITNDATLAMYQNKYVITKQVHATKVGSKLWTNIKYR